MDDTDLCDGWLQRQMEAVLARAVVVLIDAHGRPEVHQIDAAIAREAVERHYRERRVY